MKFIHIKEEQAVELWGIGDTHYGSREFMEDEFSALINHVKKTKNARVILMGDLIDTCLKNSPGAGPYDNDMTPEAQMEHIVDLLMPIKKKIWGLLDGNHENRIHKTTSIDISKIMAKYLDVPYCGNSTMIKARVGTQNYSIFAAHGSSGSTGLSGKINTVMKYSNYIQADIYLMGHVHELAHHSAEYFYIDNGDKMIKSAERHYLLTGHYLKYGGYAEQKGYKPGNTGSPKILLGSREKTIDIELE